MGGSNPVATDLFPREMEITYFKIQVFKLLPLFFVKPFLPS